MLLNVGLVVGQCHHSVTKSIWNGSLDERLLPRLIWLVPKTYCCLTGPNPFVAQLSRFVAQQYRSVSLVVSFLKKTTEKIRF